MGQRISFQLTLPRDAVRLIGIETSVRFLYCTAFMPNMRDFTAGLLTFRADGSFNTCYSSYVKVEQKILLPTDLNFWYPQAGFMDWTPISMDTVAQSRYQEPEAFDIAAPRFLNGTYVDQWGVTIGRNLTYRLSIHLWVTVNDLYNTTTI
jgi:hypothetical protein